MKYTEKLSPSTKRDNFVAVLERYKVSDGRRCGGTDA